MPELESGPLILPPYDCRSIKCGREPPDQRSKQYGSIFGTIMLAALAGGAAGPWATGLLYDLSGSYASAFAIGIAVSLLSAIAMARVAGQGEGGRGADAQGAHE